MPRPDFLECVVCHDADKDLNSRGKCAECSAAGRVAAASLAGASGRGAAKRRSTKTGRKPWSVHCATGESTMRTRKKQCHDMVRIGLNPKAFIMKIPEYAELEKLCRGARSTSPQNFSRVFLLGRGIRGCEGLRMALPFWARRGFRVEDASLRAFVLAFKRAHARAGGGSALAHREQRHHL